MLPFSTTVPSCNGRPRKAFILADPNATTSNILDNDLYPMYWDFSNIIAYCVEKCQENIKVKFITFYDLFTYFLVKPEHPEDFLNL